ncbi:S8 family serine peptidase [Patescibacteria group bacterium]|nr:S8 family serine peptidase [Patescibacteria group bacterium]MBU1991379.1 S8 family serine peptidase [Patescibacteria group bacterium]
MNKKLTSFFVLFFSFASALSLFFVGNSQIVLAATESNFSYHTSIIPSDTYFSNQWYLQKIHAVEAWDQIRESPKVVIAVIDSGVQIDHPDLVSNIWINSKETPNNGIDEDNNGYIDDINGWDFVNNVADPSPKFKSGFTEAGIHHGTVVAGIIAGSGNNATGISGVAWDAKIMSLKVLDDKGEGITNGVIKAIDYAVANGADIINLSFVGLSYSGGLNEVIKRAYTAGLIIVAAAGNEEGNGHNGLLDASPMYPVCNDGFNGENMVVGVAALDAIDQKATFSSHGFKCVDIAAPGVSIYSTIVYSPSNYLNGQSLNSYYGGYWAGTSVAVPMVSGALALIMSANPSLSREQILEILYSSADDLNKLNPNYLNQLGRGRLNVSAAVNKALASLKNNSAKIVIAPSSNLSSFIKITSQDGKEEKNFYAFDKKFKGGVNLASGDVNGDGLDEIIVGAGQGGGPHVKIFNTQGQLIGQFFAYPKNWHEGVNVTVSDIDLDGVAEIITAPGKGYSPEIKVFNFQGKLKKSFYAFDKKFKGGVNLASGDVNGDGLNEIIIGAGQGGGPHVRIFNMSGKIVSQFFAYNQSFRGGVKVAVGNIISGARSKSLEILTAPGEGAEPYIKVLDDKGNLLKQFLVFNRNFRGGVNVVTGDLDSNGIDEIIVGAGPGGAPHVRVFNSNYEMTSSFYALVESFAGGINVAVVKVRN